MNRDIFTNLRNVLAKLYPDQPSIRRIVDESGIDSLRVDLGSTTINNWHFILIEAEKNDCINILLEVVEGEYGNNREFKGACELYRRFELRSAYNSKESQSQVLDTVSVCQSFPSIDIQRLITRDYLLDAIESILDSETQVVVVEGQEGIGKTTFLAQFAIRHKNNSISLFIRPTSRWGYDLELIRFDLCNQLQWLLRQEELNPDDIASFSDSILRTQIYKLVRRANRDRKHYFFIIDGLDEIPDNENQICKLILDLLPIGLTGIKFVLSGEYSKIRNQLHKTQSKPFQLPLFSSEETKRFLGDLQFDEEILSEIHKTFHGFPIKLATIKRLLQTESITSIEQLLTEKGGALNLFEVEWDLANVNEEISLLLAILVFSRSSYTIVDLASIINIDIVQIYNIVENLSFLSVNNNTHYISFTSELFRKYTSTKVRHLEKQVYRLLIDSLLKQDKNSEARSNLPVYMHKAGRFEELLDYLSSHYFDYALVHSQSYTPIQAQVQIGLEAALNLNRTADVIRFSMHKSVLHRLSSVNPWESEVEARMAIGDYASATALAQTAMLKEDRLHLLALISKEHHKQNVEPAAEIINQIEQLVTQLDKVSLGERAVDIASKLIYVSPNLALRIIEGNEESNRDQNALDWAYLRLSLAAIDSNAQDKNQVTEQLVSRINNPTTRSIAIATAFVVKDYPASAVIHEAIKLESTGLQLHLLRSWLLKNRERSDVVQVIDYSLNILIKTTDYIPTIRDYREIASPLPHLKDKEKSFNLIRKFDGQKGIIEHLGPTKEYVRLQLLLAETEIKFDISMARSRLTDVYIYVHDIEDLSVKSECIARLISTLTRIDPENIIQLGLRENSELDLAQATSKLTLETAQQDLTVIGTIKALARYRFSDALNLALSLNIEKRRDEALSELLESAINVSLEKVDFNTLLDVLNKIKDYEIRDNALLNILEELTAYDRSLDEQKAEKLFPLLQICHQIHSAKQRCRACCLAIDFLLSYKKDTFLNFADHLLAILQKSWNTIDREWEKIDLGFKVASILARRNANVAKEYLKLAEELSNRATLNSETAAHTYILCTLLSIKAYKGLLKAKVNIDADLERICELIEFIPSKFERANLFSEVALQFFIYKQHEKCRQIVSERIKPILSLIQGENPLEYEVSVAVVAPALYCAHQLTAKSMFNHLSQPLKDKAYIKVANFILTKHSAMEPYNPPQEKVYDVDYEEVFEICELLDLMDHDASIWYFVQRLAKTLNNSRCFSKQQQAAIITHLRKICNKFPLLRHIQHNGYKLLIQASLANMEGNRDNAFWQNIFNDSLCIQNVSDRALILAHISILLPNRQQELRQKTIETALNVVEKIPSLIDKIERYEDLASIFIVIDQALAQRCLSSAMKSVTSTYDIDTSSVQKRIIDTAYGIDQKFATSLAALFDNDPARKNTSERIKHQLELLDLKSKIVKQPIFEHSSKTDYATLAWSLLGLLNGGQLSPQYHTSYFMPQLRIASDVPLNDSYPIYAFMVENFIQRFSDTDQANHFLRQTFEAILLVNGIAGRASKPSNKQIEQSRTLGNNLYLSNEDMGLLVRSGERSKAIKWLRKWLEDNLKENLIICDQFFGPADLHLLQLVQTVRPECRIQILTSWKHHTQESISEPWDEYYREHWRNNISSIQEPPVTDVVIVGIDSTKKSPIHDRWWLTESSGIRLGTSYNSMGFDSDSEISVLTEIDAEEKRQEVNSFLSQSVRVLNGKRLLYRLVTL